MTLIAIMILPIPDLKMPCVDRKGKLVYMFEILSVELNCALFIYKYFY